MLSSFGHNLLLLSLCAAVYVIGATAFAFRTAPARREAVLASAHNATLAVFGLLSVAFGVLMALFLTNDFSVNYVWAHSAIAQPTIYKISATWGGQAGSLLMWVWMLSVFGAAVAVTGRKAKLQTAPTAAAIISIVTTFFIALVVIKENPFAPTELLNGKPPVDGRGLNPLLQNYWMQIHPPTLYAGYVGCVAPFAIAFAGLLHHQFDKDWMAFLRRWTLMPWLVLTLGIIMGGAWAYETLGWGGYWAWDPVENASLMPWLTGTAFLHSIIIQARRGMLKNWNMVLVTLTFMLSVFGTFLTRSGVVSSIHSFAESDIGGYFLGFLAVTMVVSFGLILWRRDELASESEIESPLSREGAFLLNNWILLGSAFAVLWGTVFPAVSEALASQKVSIGAPYFNRVMVPLGLLLLALTGVGPLMAWRKTSPKSMLRAFALPIGIAILAAPGLWYLSQQSTGAATAFCLAVFVTVAIGSEFVRGTRARSNMTGESTGTSFVNLILKNKARYGGYIVHLGIVTMFVGFAGSSWKIETDPIKLKPNETMKVGEYTLKYIRLVQPPQTPKEKSEEVHAHIQVLRNGQQVKELYPWIDVFKSQSMIEQGGDAQSARRPDIMSNLAHDLYLVLDSYNKSTQEVSIKAYLNPLVMWVWISCGFFLAGTIIALIPDRRRVKEAAPVIQQPVAKTSSKVLQAPMAAPEPKKEPALSGKK
jgi:cytochrome c-type biogenesis protein CcmF